MSRTPRLMFDTETRSTVDLRKAGAYRYAEDPTTDVLLAGGCIDDGPLIEWRLGVNGKATPPCPPEIVEHVRNGGEIFAHHAQFDRLLWEYVLGPRYGWPVPRLEQWHCTAAMAAAMALPRSLEGAAHVLGLKVQKDVEGGRLMQRMCRPRKIGKEPVRVLVCGGRKYRDENAVGHALDLLRHKFGLAAVIHGAAPGADTLADVVARKAKVPVDPFPAAWDDLDAPGAVIKIGANGRAYNAKAGSDRNARMLAEGKPNLVLAFPGGNGTADMAATAKRAGVPVFAGEDIDALDRAEMPDVISWWEDDERMDRLVAYWAKDIYALRELAGRVRPLIPPEREIYLLDQVVNDRGLLVDLELVAACQDVVARSSKRLDSEIRRLTNGRVDKATKAKELTIWLNEQGVETDGVSKAAVRDMLSRDDVAGAAREVLLLRAEAAKSSTAKLRAMEAAANADGRVRGTLLFHGAGPGRWAGKLIQPQNFPRGVVENAELAVPSILDGDLDTLDALFGAPLDVVSSSLRSCIIAKDDHQLLIADYSNIEGRITAWAGDETWKVEAFKDYDAGTGQDLYRLAYARSFNMPVEEVDGGKSKGPQRQIGKTMELACIAGGSLVLTDTGLVPIEHVTPEHKVWDGVEWAAHEGVLARGQKPVTTYDGLTATAEHIVWVSPDHIRSFGGAARSGMPLYRTGLGAGNRAVATEGLAPVYDILNAGPRHRFTVSDVLVSNCGYQGGKLAFQTMGRNLGVVVPEEEAQRLVGAWRAAHPNVVALWRGLERAAYEAVSQPGRIVAGAAGRVRFRVVSGILWMILPSGRALSYPSPEIVKKEMPWGKETWVPCESAEYASEAFGENLLEFDDERKQALVQERATKMVVSYWGVDAKTRQWSRQYLYGGLLTENCIAVGTEVLTDAGWLAIESIATEHKVWDGVEWVSHDGVVDNGLQDVGDLWGVTMTADHLVLTTTGWCRASQSNELDWAEVRLPDGDRVRGVERGEDAVEGPRRLRDGEGLRRSRTEEGKDEQLRLLAEEDDQGAELYTRDVEAPGLSRLEVYARPVPTSDASSLGELRRAWDHGLRKVADWLRGVLGGYGAHVPAGSVARPDQQRGGVFDGELPLDRHEDAVPEHPQERHDRHPGGADAGYRSGGAQRDRRDHPPVSSARGVAGGAAFRPAGLRKQVVDIANAGPRHRFTVRGRCGEVFLVHNCVQAAASDILRHAMLKLDREGYEITMTVHDEIVCESPIGSNSQSLDHMIGLMCDLPPWAAGCPISAAGEVSRRYKK